MAHPINPHTGRMMADGCEWGPEDFARSEPFDPVVQLAIKLTAQRQASRNENLEDFARTDPATDKILEEILAERKRQDAHWGGPEHDDLHEPFVWLKCIDHQSWKAAGSPFRDEIADDYRERLVKIAALAVAALESYDRKAGK